MTDAAQPPEPPERTRLTASERTVVAVVIVCCVALALGFLLKGRCMPPEAFGRGDQYLRLCYNDIQPLFSIRGIAQGTFPYVDGAWTGSELIGGAIEYPVLTGLFMWGAGLFADDPASYLRVTALLMAPIALLTAYQLARMSGWRAMMFAAAPALVFYAFHNWDLLAVGALVAGMWSWHRGRPVWAAVWFGIGTSLKLTPVLFLLPLALEQWQSRGRRGALAALGAGIGSILAINLPFMLINLSGWWAGNEFHRVRGPNYDSMWALLQTRYQWSAIQMPTLNTIVAGATLATFVIAFVYGHERLRREGVYPFLQVGAALLAAFLLWNKVHSPQYTLWLLPMFVVLNVNMLWWLAYTLVDAAVYAGVFRWFYDIVYLQIGDSTPAKEAMIWGVWLRAGLLVALIVVFLRAKRAPIPPSPNSAFFLSHPRSKVEDVGEVTTA